VVEIAISWKFRDGIRYFLDVSTLFEISWPWILAMVAAFTYYLYLRFKRENRVYSQKL